MKNENRVCESSANNPAGIAAARAREASASNLPLEDQAAAFASVGSPAPADLITPERVLGSALKHYRPHDGIAGLVRSGRKLSEQRAENQLREGGLLRELDAAADAADARRSASQQAALESWRARSGGERFSGERAYGFHVPAWAEFVAVDQSGDVWAYEQRPSVFLEAPVWALSGRGSRLGNLDPINFRPYALWRSSLLQRAGSAWVQLYDEQGARPATNWRAERAAASFVAVALLISAGLAVAVRLFGLPL